MAAIPKKRTHRQFADFGPAERLARGEVIITGERQHRRGRAVDIVFSMDQQHREAAAWLLALWEAAEYQGWACTSLMRGGSGGTAGPSDRAMGARRSLRWISDRVERWQWSVIFHVLLMGETQVLYSRRARVQRGYVTPMLRTALLAVSCLQRGDGKKRMTTASSQPQ